MKTKILALQAFAALFLTGSLALADAQPLASMHSLHFWGSGSRISILSDGRLVGQSLSTDHTAKLAPVIELGKVSEETLQSIEAGIAHVSPRSRLLEPAPEHGCAMDSVITYSIYGAQFKDGLLTVQASRGCRTSAQLPNRKDRAFVAQLRSILSQAYSRHQQIIHNETPEGQN